ncbi:hypothetical protein ACFL6C_09020 [Myxococcota bacterium]
MSSQVSLLDTAKAGGNAVDLKLSVIGISRVEVNGEIVFQAQPGDELEELEITVNVPDKEASIVFFNAQGNTIEPTDLLE